MDKKMEQFDWERFTISDDPSDNVRRLKCYYEEIVIFFFQPFFSKMWNTYILIDVLFCSIAEYFYELCRILASP